MANALKTHLKGVADAIREMTGEEGSMKPSEFADKIRSISGGSGESTDLVKYVTFVSHDGTVELYKKPTISGDDCVDVVAEGLLATPTRESTNTQNFTYSGWSTVSGGSAESNALKDVTEDRILYAAYTSSVRYYTVNFYDDDGTTLLNTVQVTYGADATYTPDKKNGYRFVGWSADVTNVTSDLNVYAQWEETKALQDLSWEEIAEISESGNAKDYWNIGDTKTFKFYSSTFTAEIVGFDHDDLADGSGKAGISFISKNVAFTAFHNIATTTYNKTTWAGCYARSEMNNALNNTSAMESALASVVKTVIKKYYDLNDSTVKTTEDKMWAPSLSEIGCGSLADEGDRYEKYTSNKSVGSTYAELKKYDGGGTAQVWATRTKTSSGTKVYGVNISGVITTVTQGSSTASSGFGFCI